MTWSFKLARIAGIDVYVHATFVVLLAWIALLHWNQDQSLIAVAEGVGYILALFGCVVAHEYGHALTARRFGIRTADITLLPIGGLARLERMPEKPSQELLVALAGPAVNVVIAALLFGWLTATGWRDGAEVGVTTGGLVPRIMMANVFLVGFNLLPAFPMDGGRALRAMLATRMAYADATRMAASIGQGMALFFGFLGLFGNPMLIFIALFVWIGAGQEAGMAQVKSALSGIPVRGAMLTHFRSLTPRDTLGEAVDLLLAGSQQDFPVTDEGSLVGMLSRADLIAALGSAGRDALVSAHVRRRCTPADPDEPLEPVLARLQSEPCRTLPVLAGGALVGLLTLENVGELLMVQASERKTRSGTSTSPLVPALVGMLAMLSLVGRQPAQTFTGTISDSVCALSHAPMRMGPTDAECTHACIEEHGASYVLVTGTDVYQLSDQRAPKAFAGKPVKVVGTLDAASRTITVVSISGG